MAKLFKFEGVNKDFIKGLLLIIALSVFVIISVGHYEKEHENQSEATEYAVGIHVKGAVENPGFYEVPYGTRVMDIEEYAGKFSENADLDGVNLAEYVRDGEEVYIPYKGTAQSGALNLNTASYEELIEIEGIGDNYARKIISYRNEHGEYEKVIELKSVLGTKVYEDVRESFYVE